MEEMFKVDSNGQWSLLEKARRPEDDERDARTKSMIEQFMADKAKREAAKSAPRPVPPPAQQSYPAGMRPVSQERMTTMNHRPTDSRNAISDDDRREARLKAEKRFREKDAESAPVMVYPTEKRGWQSDMDKLTARMQEDKRLRDEDARSSAEPLKTPEDWEGPNRALPKSAKLVPVAGKNTTLSSKNRDEVDPLVGASFHPRIATEAEAEAKAKAEAKASAEAAKAKAEAEAKPKLAMQQDSQGRKVVPNAAPRAKSGPIVEHKPSLSKPIAPRAGEFQLPRSLDQVQTDRHDRSNLGNQKKYTVEGLPPSREGMYHGELYSTRGKIVQKPLFFHNKETDERGRKMVDQQEMHDWRWNAQTKEWEHTGSRLATPKE